jgi:hypothetical protein
LVKRLATSVKQLFSEPHEALKTIWQERQERQKAESTAANYTQLLQDIALLSDDLQVTFKREVGNYTDADVVAVASQSMNMQQKFKELSTKVKFHLIGFEQNEAKTYIELAREFLPTREYAKATKNDAKKEAQNEILKMPRVKMNVKSAVPDTKMTSYELEELLDRSEKYRVVRAIQYYVKKNIAENDKKAAETPLEEKFSDAQLLKTEVTTETLKAELSQLRNPVPKRKATEDLDEDGKASADKEASAADGTGADGTGPTAPSRPSQVGSSGDPAPALSKDQTFKSAVGDV